MGPVAVDDDLRFALELADIAAELSTARFGRRLAVSLKTDLSPVTAVDAAVEEALDAHVRRHRPGDGFLGEESGHRESSTGRTWIVDPIDGTALFAEGIPLWSTLVALRLEEQVPGSADGVVVGVADAPALGDRCHAAHRRGAWGAGRRLRVSDVASLDDAFVLHAGPQDFGADRLDALVRLTSAVRGSRGISDAWAHVLVARGAAEALVEVAPCQLWDWAATSVILTEAGGRLSALDGGPPRAGGGLLVSNSLVDDAVRSALRMAEPPTVWAQ